LPNIGLTELLVLLAIALLVIGPKRLPDIGRQVGRAIREFRRAGSTVTKELGLDEVADDVRDIRQSAQKAKDSVNVRKQLGLDDLGPLDLDGEEKAAATPTAAEKAAAAAATAAEAADHSLAPATPAPASDDAAEPAEADDALSGATTASGEVDDAPAEAGDALAEAGDADSQTAAGPAPGTVPADAAAASTHAADTATGVEEPSLDEATVTGGAEAESS